MIITRTPLRISLGGGGTDLPAYYREHGGGYLVAAAITKYVYIAVNRNFDDDILLKYSQVERCAKPEQVRHPILRESLLCHGHRPRHRGLVDGRHPRRHRARVVGLVHGRRAARRSTPTSAS